MIAMTSRLHVLFGHLRSVECCGILRTGYNAHIQKEVNAILVTVHKVDCTMKIP